MGRPFFTAPIDRLETLARSADTSLQLLRELRDEIGHRTTLRAARLRRELDRRLLESSSHRSQQSGVAGTDLVQMPLALSAGSPMLDGSTANMYDASQPKAMANAELLPVTILSPSVRARGLLARMKISTIGDLAAKSPAELLRQPNCGRKTLHELQIGLRSFGLEFHEPAAMTEIRQCSASLGEAPDYNTDMFNVRLSSLGLSARARSFLRRRQIVYAGQLCQLPEAEIWRTPNVGRTTVRELALLLQSLGLRFGIAAGGWTAQSARTHPAPTLPSNLKPPEPDRLDDALRARLASVTSSERNLCWTVEHLGWAGEPGQTLEAIGRRHKVTRERVRQVAAKSCRALRERQSPPLALRRTIAIIRANLPLMQSQLDRLLRQRGLASRSFHVAGIGTAAKVFGLRFPFIVMDRDADPLILPRSMAGFSNDFLQAARRKVSTFGCVNDDQLARLAEEVAGKQVGLSMINAIIDQEGSFARFEKAPDWWWRPDKARRRRNRLVNTIMKVLAVSSVIRVRELRDAIRRPHRSHHIAPPSIALSALCASLPFCRVADGRVERGEREGGWNEVLNPSEQLLVKIFEQFGPVVHSHVVSEEGMAFGVNESSLAIYKTYSPLLWRPVPGYYALVGSDIEPGSIEALQARRPGQVASFVESGWTADMRMFLCYRITKGIWHSGLTAVPASVQPLLRGTFELTGLGSEGMGTIEIRNGTVFSFRKLFRIFGAEEGDVLLALFDPRHARCEAWLGGSEMAQLVSDGKADEVIAGLNASIGGGGSERDEGQ